MPGLDALNGSIEGTLNSDLPLCCSAASTNPTHSPGHGFRERRLHKELPQCLALCGVVHKQPHCKISLRFAGDVHTSQKHVFFNRKNYDNRE